MTSKEILRKTLRAMMRTSEKYRDRKSLAGAAGISARAVGYMLQKDAGNPTLAHIEAVARVFKLEAWELLIDHAETKRRLITKILSAEAASDARLHENGIHPVKHK